MTALQAVLGRLAITGVGVEGRTLFGGSDSSLPSSGAGLLTVVPTGGRQRVQTHNGSAVRRPSFQITARADDYRVAEALASSAYSQLDVANIAFGAVFFLHVSPMQEPFAMPPDANGRARVSFNIATAHR